MKKLIILFCVLSTTLKAQDTNKHYSPSITLYGGFVNSLNAKNAWIFNDLYNGTIGAGSDIGLNIYAPFRHSTGGILLMLGEQSNSILYEQGQKYSMTGNYIMPCIYFTIHTKPIDILVHFGGGIEFVSIPNETFLPYPSNASVNTPQPSYFSTYSTQSIDGSAGVEARYYASKKMYICLQLNGLYRSEILQEPPSVPGGHDEFIQTSVYDWIINIGIGYKF